MQLLKSHFLLRLFEAHLLSAEAMRDSAILTLLQNNHALVGSMFAAKTPSIVRAFFDRLLGRLQSTVEVESLPDWSDESGLERFEAMLC
jgi:hypothetical protein